jgi:hypothetical protein
MIKETGSSFVGLFAVGASRANRRSGASVLYAAYQMKAATTGVVLAESAAAQWPLRDCRRWPRAVNYPEARASL